MKVITVRIPDEALEALEAIEKAEKVDRAAAVRKLLAEGVARWKVRHALELLADRRVSLRAAARVAGVTYGEMYDLAARRGLTAGYTLEDLNRDLRSR